MKWLWIMICVFCAVLLEALLGGCNCPLPVGAVTVFYVTVIFGWRRVAPAAIAGALMLDALYGREFCTTVLLQTAVLIMAHFWRLEGNCRVTGFQAVPGAAVGTLAAALLLGITSFMAEQVSWDLCRHNLWLAGQIIVGSAVLLPGLCLLLDRLAQRLELPRYQQIQQEQHPSHVS